MIGLLVALRALAEEPTSIGEHPSEVPLDPETCLPVGDWNLHSRHWRLRPNTELLLQFDPYARSAAATVRWGRVAWTERDYAAAEIFREWLLRDGPAEGEAIDAAATPDGVRVTWAGPGDRASAFGERALSWADDPLAGITDDAVDAARERVVARYAETQADTWGRRWRLVAPQLYPSATTGFRPGHGWSPPPLTAADLDLWARGAARIHVVVSGPGSLGRGDAPWNVPIASSRVLPGYVGEREPAVEPPPDSPGPTWVTASAGVDAPTLLVSWSLPTLTGERRALGVLAATWVGHLLHEEFELEDVEEEPCGLVVDSRASTLICALPTRGLRNAGHVFRRSVRVTDRPLPPDIARVLRSAWFCEVIRLGEPWPPGPSSRTAVVATAMAESNSARALSRQINGGSSEEGLDELLDDWILPSRAHATWLRPLTADR